MKRIAGWISASLAVGVAAGACTYQPVPPPTPAGAEAGRIANPASENCLTLGGTLILAERASLGQYGVCVFPEGGRCEEWAMLRGECPVGGVDVSGYASEVAVFCAITGGAFEPGDDGLSTCTFRNGRICDAQEYYDGACWKDETGVQ